MKTHHWIFGIVLVLTLGYFAFGENVFSATESVPPSIPVQSFHYQLQDADFASLQKLSVDVLVVDIDDARLTPAELNALHQSGKKVLSYLSIGEAEDYRDYWQESWDVGQPAFLDEENPDWEGNFKVKYWQSAWQKIIFQKTEAIARAGYDGVYLDIIDAYEYYKDNGRTRAATDMVNFVSRIAKKGRAVNPNFLIVPQNSPELYRYSAYRRVVSGFGKEDTWYNDDDVQSGLETKKSLRYLSQAVQKGKFVLAIDYPTETENICDFYEKCEAAGFACTVSNRDLDLDTSITCED